MNKEGHLEAIKKADHEYYDLDNPSMTDAEYDKLRRDYIDKYGTEDLDYVPGNVSEGFEKFKHPTPVTSLSKWTKGVDKKEDLIKKIKELWPIEIQPKYDGLTVVAYPNPDGSCKYVTRGLGGEVGEVLPNFIPRYEGPRINNSGYAIRGEVFITAENFKWINKALTDKGEEPMKNVRNAAAGLLRRKDRSPYLNLLKYIVYDLPGQDMTPEEMRSIITEKTEFMFTNGRPFVDEDMETVCKGIGMLYEEINWLKLYPIDGIVIKSCQEHSLEKFGSTAHHNRNAFAYKAARTVYTTVVRDVVWQMGRNKATPVAIVDPVEIDGATVTKASLHNAEQIKKLGLKIGAKVAIYKANEIIPQIGEVLEPGDKDIVLDVCPSCGKPLTEINGQQFCTNPVCEERIAQNIAFLGKKDVLDIPGLSIKTARKMVSAYPGAADIYGQNMIFKLDYEDLKTLPGFAEKSAEKLFRAIQQARVDVELPRFIKALCIPGIGNDIGKILADEFEDLDTMNRMFSFAENRWSDVVPKLQTINGIGPVTAKILCSGEFWDAVYDLYDVIISIAPYKKKEIAKGKLAGKTFVLTGKMEHARSYYEELIKKAGGKIASAVSKTTDFLVIADVYSQSSKAKKARELGTKLISPEELEAITVQNNKIKEE